MTSVANGMTTPAVVVRPEAMLDEITRTFERHSISAVPVVSNDVLVGVVSTTDVLRAAWNGATPQRAEALMSTPPLVARPSEPMEEAARRLVAGRAHRLVVVDGQRTVGVLSSRDILAGLESRRIAEPIQTIMSAPVETVEIGDRIDYAVGKLAVSNVHGLVVVDGRAPVGVLTHREALAARVLPPDLRARPVEDIMSYETICLDVATPIYRAVAYALAMNVRRFLVVEHRGVVGIVSTLDLVGVLARASGGRS